MQNKLLICGYPRAGKTEYSKQFENVIHTDDYMEKYDFKEVIYKILEDIKDKDDWVIEGIQCVRLFRKMLQTGESLPEKVIWISSKYQADKKHKGVRKMLDKVWSDCLELNKDAEVCIE